MAENKGWGGSAYVGVATRLKSALLASSILLASLPGCSGGDGSELANEGADTSTSALSIFVGMTAMTPCMLQQRISKGSYYLRVTFAPGNPIYVLYLGKGDVGQVTSGSIDLGAQVALATVNENFWLHALNATQPTHFAIEYDPLTGAILEVYEC